MKTNQGQSAVRAGQKAEQIIDCILKDRGYIVSKQYLLCKSIYGHPLKTDRYVHNVTGFPSGLAIESKWQDGTGSVDEKFPYLVTNIKNCFPCPAIVVYGGGGFKKGAIPWLKNHVDDKKFVAALTFEEFLSWVNRKMPPAFVLQRSDEQIFLNAFEVCQ